MEEENQLPPQGNHEKLEQKELVDDELKHYRERAAELAKKGLIAKEDEEHVMAEMDPDKAKSILLAALEKRHKEAREAYMNNASDKRQGQAGSGLA